jgi:hypothetical protein
MTDEGVRQRRIMLAVSAAGARIFRNNNAMGWVGRAVQIKHPQRVVVGPGDVVIYAARPLHAGICPGSGDLIGWTPLLVGAEHVGAKIPVFTNLEVKVPGGRAQENQKVFDSIVRAAGGVSAFVHTDEEALAAIASVGSM